MGFFDYRCSMTGVSLKASDAVFLPLVNENGKFLPVTLGMKGCYNRLGSIDGIEENENTACILRFFLEGLESGEVGFDEDCIEGLECYPINTIEDLLACLERHINDSPNPVFLNGKPVEYALISSEIWEFLVENSNVTEGSSDVMWATLFPESSVARRIYERNEATVLPQLRELFRVSMEMQAQRIEWTPINEPSQHYGEEMTEFLNEAKTRFKDAPLFLGALAAYEDEVSEFLEDEENE